MAGVGKDVFDNPLFEVGDGEAGAMESDLYCMIVFEKNKNTTSEHEEMRT